MTKKGNLVLSREISEQDNAEPRLRFLSEFMRVTGDCAADIARATGVTRGGVSHWFSCDDCRLSYCEQYISQKGYDLVIELKKPSLVSESGNVRISIERRTAEPDGTECRRLLFLLDAMARYGVTKAQIAEALQIKYNTVRHWFVVDDIYISHIFNIAHLFGLQVHIDIRPSDSE